MLYIQQGVRRYARTTRGQVYMNPRTRMFSVVKRYRIRRSEPPKRGMQIPSRGAGELGARYDFSNYDYDYPAPRMWVIKGWA